jgi:hypothetical protein
MKDYKIQSILKRFENMKTERSKMEHLYSDIDRFVMDRDGWFTSGRITEGNRSHEVYSKAGVKYNIRFASTLQGLVAPAEQRWFTLETSFINPSSTSYEARQYLDLLEETLYSTFSSTNFYQKSLELLTDYTAYGLAGMYIASDPEKRIRFISVPLREMFIDTDFNGEINTVARHFTTTLRSLEGRFQKSIQGDAQSFKQFQANPDTTVECLHIVMPNDKYNPKSNNSSNKRYKSCYILKTNDLILEEMYLSTMPYVTPRWTVYSGEVYGRSQAMIAIPDLKVMSAMVKNALQGVNKLANPPLLVSADSIAGRGLNLTPDGVTVIDKLQGGTFENTIKVLDSKARPDIALSAIDMWERKISELFFADMIQEDKQARMSATESSTRQMLRITNISPQIGRLEPEYLDKLIERCISILLEDGHIPPPPEDLQNVKIEYRSPLAKAQKMQSLDGVQQFLQLAMGMAQIDPAIPQYINTDYILQYMSIATDIPTGVLKSPQDIEQIKQAMAQQQEQQQKLQGMEQATNIAKNAGSAEQSLATAEAMGNQQ